jgi:hypothetical protein
VDEWGPFDFRRPIATLDTVAGNLYSLVLIGPSGDWKIAKMEGVRSVSARKGTVPATLTLERDPKSDAVFVEFEYSSPQAIRTVFGKNVPAGKLYTFDFQRFEKKLDWTVQFCNLPEDLDFPKPFTFSETSGPKGAVAEKKVGELAFAWWGSPAEGVKEDKFSALSIAEFGIAPGEYVLELTSDDGVRLYLDGKILIDNWDIHEPETDEITVRLGGRHQLRIEHFDAGGFATLDFRMRVKR